jgi:hypothetical protein
MEELYFEYGCEGGGAMLFRLLQNDGNYYYSIKGNSFDIGDSGIDHVRHWKKEFKTFEEFWNYFINSLEKWYMFHVLFIHDELKVFIKEELDKMEKDKGYEYKKETWERALKKMQ